MRVVAAFLGFLIALTVALCVLTPIPAALLIRAVFDGGMAVPPEGYESMQKMVEVKENLRYPSKYADNFADVYIPKSGEGAFPVVLWVHGGAFVGGDKGDNAVYATALASEGFAVVCINYRRAPAGKYPTPLVQTNEAYQWLHEIADEYSLDMSRFVLAGDSAGAHIAVQFAAVQSNPVYAQMLSMEQVVPQGTLKASLLFCGPYNLAKIEEGSSPLLNFLMSNAAWAYFGTREWGANFADQATIYDHLTADFPPSFISDGNTASFEEHARELAEVLEQKGVFVQTYFVSIEKEEAIHEYQFIMNTPAGVESFRETVAFLKAHTAI